MRSISSRRRNRLELISSASDCRPEWGVLADAAEGRRGWGLGALGAWYCYWSGATAGYAKAQDARWAGQVWAAVSVGPAVEAVACWDAAARKAGWGADDSVVSNWACRDRIRAQAAWMDWWDASCRAGCCRYRS